MDPAKIGVVGIVWPATQFTTDFDNAAAAGAAGGTRSVGDGEQAGDLSSAAFEAKLKEVRDLFGADADAIIEAAREAADGITFETANALFRASRAAVVAPRTDPELAKNRAFFDPNDSPDVVLNSLQEPPSIKAAPQMGHVSGLGDAIGGLFNGPRAAVGRVLNQLTYYEMKARAGVVGAALGGRVLPSLQRLARQAPAPRRPLIRCAAGDSGGERAAGAFAVRILQPDAAAGRVLAQRPFGGRLGRLRQRARPADRADLDHPHAQRQRLHVLVRARLAPLATTPPKGSATRTTYSARWARTARRS